MLLNEAFNVNSSVTEDLDDTKSNQKWLQAELHKEKMNDLIDLTVV